MKFHRGWSRWAPSSSHARHGRSAVERTFWLRIGTRYKTDFTTLYKRHFTNSRLSRGEIENMRQSLTIQAVVSLLVALFVASPLLSGCKRTLPEPPSLTEEVKTAIQAEDQAVFQQESAQK